jgi:hypothetical protein
MKNCLFEGIITSQKGGTMKKGEKALKYADLVWGDEKLKRITLEELCRSWNLNRLLQEGELSCRG